MELNFDKFYNRLKAEEDPELRRDLMKMHFMRFQDGDYVEWLEFLLKSIKSEGEGSQKQGIISDFCRVLPNNLSSLCKSQLCELLANIFFDLPYWKGRVVLLDRLLDWNEVVNPDVNDNEFSIDFPVRLIESGKTFDDENEFERFITMYYKIAEKNVSKLINDFEILKKKHGQNRHIDDFIERVKSKLQIQGLEKTNGPQLRQIYFNKIVATKRIHDNILLLGPSGVGKSTIVNIIYKNSSLHKRFIKTYYCDQGENEWNRLLKDLKSKGFNGCTVFLDELHMLSRKIQRRFVTVFEKKKIRIISASSMTLEGLTRRMFIDFWRRYKGHEVEIPPLSERPSDLKDFLKTYVNNSHRMEIDDETIGALSQHKWPGNYSDIEVFFSDVCTVMKNYGKKRISLALLREYNPSFEQSNRDIVNKYCMS